MKKCDLVMKGGITSGIVYPQAVLELSREFRFVNIGGTSAGAIAAALTAAAELRRQRTGSAAGFEAIAELPSWMAERVDDRSRLMRLFEPEGETAPLFEAAVAWIETQGSRTRKAFAALRTLVRGFPRWGSIAASVGLLLVILTGAGTLGVWPHAPLLAVAMLLPLLALAGLSVAAVGAGAMFQASRSATRLLPKQGFGLCSGLALSQWLADRIDAVAGVEEPVTFRDLEAAGIHLEMMTTSLTHGRPYRLPLEGRRFYFDPDELRRLMPERIVDWMVARAPPGRRRPRTREGAELVPFPLAELPVVVAARMSLSFPLLLSAVPLWGIDFARREGTVEPERCWFSDGGITSNFPVHFFDAPIPRWPTFAINLAPRSDRYHAAGQDIYVPRTNRSGILEWWTPFDSLSGFLGSILDTMQNWRDTMLLHMPGQRDRIAHVLLGEEEGGLNLSMDAETIARVAARGGEAGRTFRARLGSTPDPDAKLTWANHRWVRYLSLMGAVERALEQWEEAFLDESEPPALATLLQGEQPLPSYKVSPAHRVVMQEASERFLRQVRTTFAARPFTTSAKRPRPNAWLRAMPRE